MNITRRLLSRGSVLSLACVGLSACAPPDDAIHAAVGALLALQWRDMSPSDARQRASMTAAQAAQIQEIQSTIHLTYWRNGTPVRRQDGNWNVELTYQVEYTMGGQLFRYDSTATAVLARAGLLGWTAASVDAVRAVGGPVRNAVRR